MTSCHKKSHFLISIPLAGWQETLRLLPTGWQETKKSPASRLAGDTSFENSKLEEWHEKWLLKLNVDECCTMHYGHNNTEHTYYLNKDGF